METHQIYITLIMNILYLFFDILIFHVQFNYLYYLTNQFQKNIFMFQIFSETIILFVLQLSVFFKLYYIKLNSLYRLLPVIYNFIQIENIYCIEITRYARNLLHSGAVSQNFFQYALERIIIVFKFFFKIILLN